MLSPQQPFEAPALTRPGALPALTHSEESWEIACVSKLVPDHVVRCDRLRLEGWEPYGVDDDGLHFRRRKLTDFIGLVVVPEGTKRTAARIFHDWHIITAPYEYQRRLPRGVDRIVMAWKPANFHEADWVRTTLKPLLTPPNELEWLV